MKNEKCKERTIKKYIVKNFIDFKNDVRTALGNDVEIICDFYGIYFECNEECLYSEEILNGMSKYYNVEVTSIHIDNTENIGVYIEYK